MAYLDYPDMVPSVIGDHGLFDYPDMVPSVIGDHGLFRLSCYGPLSPR